MSKPLQEMTEAELVGYVQANYGPNAIGFQQAAIAELQTRAVKTQVSLLEAIKSLDANLQRNANVAEKQTRAIIGLTVAPVAATVFQIVLMLTGKG